MKAKIYYCYEKNYPFVVHYLDESGQDRRVASLEECERWGDLMPGAIQLSRGDYARRMRLIARERQKLAQWKEGTV